jgi:phosphoribosylanthranilate isomerase
VIRVKVCGVTSAEDAELAASLGATAVGMVFWIGSPRAVDVERAKLIALALPTFVTAVGVFVDQSVDEVSAIADAVKLDAIQLHGHENASDYAALGRRLIKSVAVRDRSAEAEADRVPAGATVLLDAHDPLRRGGTGQTIDWTVAATIARRRPVILSGGLTPETVDAAVRAVRPYAIDVSSGVESSPGRKDPTKLRAFFAALRAL